MAGIDIAFPITLGREGGLSMDPTDKGNYPSGQVGVGPLYGTIYGISSMAYPAMLAKVPANLAVGFPYPSDIATLTQAQAKILYQFNEWAQIGGDALPIQIACLTFDAEVNMGGIGGVVLQRALGVEADGMVGPKTKAAANAAKLPDILDEITVRRMIQYTLDSEWRTDGLGWTRRCIAVLNAVKAIPTTEA